MIDYNAPIYVEWDNALEGLRAAHEAYRRQLDEPSAKTRRAPPGGCARTV